jgi:HAE1 family hydrophobic/amphiphilic exporter-1
MRAPMARAVIGGLITSTLLSLLVVPVVYTFLDDFRPSAAFGWLKRRRPAPSPRHEGLPVPTTPTA